MGARNDIAEKPASSSGASDTGQAAPARSASISPLGRAALRLARCHQAYLDAAVAPYGIVGSHVPLLLYLAEGGDGHTQNDIARAVGLDKGTVSRRIAQLVRMGVVSQTTSELDSRAHRVALTEKGHALAKPISAISQRWDEEVANDISDETRDQLLEELGALNARAELLLADARAERATGAPR